MKRRDFIQSAGALMLLAGSARWSRALAAVAGGEIQNFVYITADDHAQLNSTPYGATDVRTPNFQRLANDGLTFTHAFCVSPSCCPSRTSMLTGLNPARNGCQANHTFKHPNIPWLPPILHKMGYDVASFGKVADPAPKKILHNCFPDGGTRDDSSPETVRAYLSKRDPNKPLCLFLGSHHPHVPWDPAEGYDPAALTLPPTFIDTPQTRAARAQYYTDVTKLDEWVGQMYDLVRSTLKGSTLIVYTADHGAQWPFGKWDLYDAGVRLPFIAVWDGKIKPGTKCDAMFALPDVVVSFIELAGGKAPDGLDGQSIAPIFLGRSTTARDRIFGAQTGDETMNIYPSRSLRTRDWSYIRNLHPEFAHTTYIDKGYAEDGGSYWGSWQEKAKTDPAAAAVVERYYKRPAEELYDMKADPFQLHNLAADPAQAARLAEMRGEVDAWMKQQGDTELVADPPRLLSDPASTQPSSTDGEIKPAPGEKKSEKATTAPA